MGDHDIKQLVESASLISEFVDRSLQGASYDLRLGDEHFAKGAHHRFNDDAPSYELQAGQFALLTSYEKLKLPRDVVAHAGLMSQWAQRGLISLFSPQIDPGFEGLIVVPVFNAGNAPITLKMRDAIFTVEFLQMSCPASESWIDRHEPLLGIPSGVEIKMASPDLADLGRKLDAMKSKVDGLQGTVDGYRAGASQRTATFSLKATVIGVAVAVLAIPAGLWLGGVDSPWSNGTTRERVTVTTPAPTPRD